VLVLDLRVPASGAMHNDLDLWRAHRPRAPQLCHGATDSSALSSV